jgi:cell division protein FtsB
MDSGQLTAVLIVMMVMIGSIARARYGYGRFGRLGRYRRDDEGTSAQDRAENLRLRDEVKELKERIKVLERITVEKENSLAKEIESLRDR